MKVSKNKENIDPMSTIELPLKSLVMRKFLFVERASAEGQAAEERVDTLGNKTFY